MTTDDRYRTTDEVTRMLAYWWKKGLARPVDRQ
jgi:hypothetical protein